MNNRRIVFGLILVVVGFLLLAQSTGLFYINSDEFFSLLFPVLFIVAGLWLIARKRRSERVASVGEEADAYRSQAESQHFHSGQTSPPPHHHVDPATKDAPRVSEKPSTGNHGRLKYHKFLGDMYIDFNGVNIQNVEVSSFIGDIELRLHGAILAPGLNRIVISGFIGDLRILHSQDLPIFAQCSNFIGDLELMGKRASGFGNNLEAQTANYGNADSKLYIAGNLFIGDIRMYTV